MKRGQQIFDARPEIARRRKPCSKIETKLRLRRRGKFESEIEKSTRESPRLSRNKNRERSYGGRATSGTDDDDDSPRLFTSKQHVELVNFEYERVTPLPRLTKFSTDFSRSRENSAKNCEKEETRKPRKCSSHTFVTKKTYSVRGTWTNADIRESRVSEIHGNGEKIDEKNLSAGNERKCDENSMQNFVELSDDRETGNDSNKKRSRSAPCTPLFRIKCAKEKYSRNFFADGKSFGEKSLRAEIRKLRKLRSKELRISRSGDVSVGSRDALSEERIVERSSLKAFDGRVEKFDSLLFTKNDRSNENAEAETTNCDNCGDVAAGESENKAGKEEINSKANSPEESIFSEEKLVEKNEAVEEKNEAIEEKNKGIEEKNEPIEEKNNENLDVEAEKLENERETTVENNDNVKSIVDKNVEIVEIASKNVDAVKKEKSPRKPPKKRAFKWETILEKQHRQSVPRSPENQERSSEIVKDRNEDDRFNFCNEKSGNCSKHCRCPRFRGKSSENRRLEAYNLIREELPKILMKRRHAEAAQRMNKGTNGVKLNNSSPERPKEHPKVHNFRFDSSPFEELNRRSGFMHRRYNSPSKKHVERSSPKIYTDVPNDDLHSKLETFERSEISAEATKIYPPSSIGDSIEISEHPKINKSNRYRRASILKHRKAPSPRRVTFRLPGRIIDGSSTEDESNAIDKFTEIGKTEFGNREINCSKMSKENIEKNEKSRKTEVKIVDDEHNRGREKIRRHDDVLETCIAEKARRFRSENLPTAIDTKRLREMQNDGSNCRRLLSDMEERNGCQSEDSEQDWETPSGEDAYRPSRDVSFPKETREAMKILLRAKENASKHHCHERMVDREDLRQRHLRSETVYSPKRNSTFVSKSYAKALAKFQEGCNIDVHENSSRTPTSSARLRGSRKTNEAGGK